MNKQNPIKKETLPLGSKSDDFVADDSSMDPVPRRIQSVEVGFRLVRVIEKASVPLTLKEVSVGAGMSRSKAHLYLATFLGLGLIARDASGCYMLGSYALQLGMSALRKHTVVDVSDHALHSLQAATGHSVHISIWGNHGPTIVKKLDGGFQIPVSSRVGFVMPLLSTATGRVFLAYEKESLIIPVLEKEKLKANLKNQASKILIEGIREAGYASSDGSLYEGFAALSAPIFNHAGELCAAIAVVDSASRMPMEKRPETATRLKQAANEISALLGG